jgi:hypothetical protein
MEREERERHDVENRRHASTRPNTANPRVWSVTKTNNLDPRW